MSPSAGQPEKNVQAYQRVVNVAIELSASAVSFKKLFPCHTVNICANENRLFTYHADVIRRYVDSKHCLLSFFERIGRGRRVGGGGGGGGVQTAQLGLLIA